MPEEMERLDAAFSPAGAPSFYYWRASSLPPESLRLRLRPSLAAAGDATHHPLGIILRQPAARRSDGVVRHKGCYYVEVMRKSTYAKPACTNACFTEPYSGGWYHHAMPGSGVFLRADAKVMDFTCAPWVSHAPLASLAVIQTGRFSALCLAGWCVPSGCRNVSYRDAKPTWSTPAHLREDPMLNRHGLTKLGFKIGIGYWARDYASWHDAGLKTIIDFRPTDVQPASYKNGTIRMACSPQGHHYYVAQWRQPHGWRMERCLCDHNQEFLNCAQLRRWQAPSACEELPPVPPWGAPGAASGREPPLPPPSPPVPSRGQAPDCVVWRARVIARGPSACADLPAVALDPAGRPPPATAIEDLLKRHSCNATGAYVAWPPRRNKTTFDNFEGEKRSVDNVGLPILPQPLPASPRLSPPLPAPPGPAPPRPTATLPAPRAPPHSSRLGHASRGYFDLV